MNTLTILVTAGSMALVPVASIAAAVSYNDLLAFNGFNNVPTTLSLDFTYETDTREFTVVKGIYNDGGQAFPANFEFFNRANEINAPSPNFLYAIFTSTKRDLARYSFETSFFIGTDLNDPLTLAGQSTNNPYSVFSYCSIKTCTEFAPTETLTRLAMTGNAASVPLPPALLLFGASLFALYRASAKKVPAFQPAI